MQMWLTGITGGSDSPQHLASPNAISCLDAYASWKQMQIISELATPQVQGDGISGNGFQGDRHRRVERGAVSGDVVRQAVPRRDDTPISNRQYRLSIGVIRMHVLGITRK